MLTGHTVPLADLLKRDPFVGRLKVFYYFCDR